MAWDAVRPALALRLDEAEVELRVRADQGDARAQAEVGALFALAALRDAKAAIPYGERLSATAHLLAADASHALQDFRQWLLAQCQPAAEPHSGAPAA